MLESLTLERCAEWLNETFRLQSDAADPGLEVGLEVDLELIEVQATGSEQHGQHRAPFSLVFRGPKESPLPQQIYKLKNDRIGELDLFLVPIGPDKAGLLYEAVFN